MRVTHDHVGGRRYILVPAFKKHFLFKSILEKLEISHLCLRLMSEYIKLKRIGGRQRVVVSWYWLFEAFLFKNITTKYKTTH